MQSGLRPQPRSAVATRQSAVGSVGRAYMHAERVRHVLRRAAFWRLAVESDVKREPLPRLPRRGEGGNYPAVEYATAVLARKIIRQRRAIGLTQADLAREAGIRPETLNRIERGKAAPSIATVDRIARAIEHARADAEAER